MKSEKKTFVIVDALALAYKAYFAFINRPLLTSKGEPTSAVYGFITQLFKIIEDTSPDYIAIAFDSKEKTFRHEMYDKYKSSRAAMPDDMIPQIQRIRDVVEAFNIPVYIKPGFEADDLVGTAVKQAEDLGLTSYMVTPDKDYIQLVTENTVLVKPGRSTDEVQFIDIPRVKEDMGFEPPQMIDYLALVGDSSDDIPGVAGIGPKSATPLIQEFGSIEGIYKNIDKIEKKGIKTKLETNEENAVLSKTLATIVTDAPIKVNLKEIEFREPNFDLLLEMFKEMEFKTFGDRLLALFNKKAAIKTEEEIKEAAPVKQNVNYKLITTAKEARKLCDKLSKSKVLIFDTETDSLNIFEAKLVGASFSVKENEAYFTAVNPLPDSDGLFDHNLSDRIPLNEFVEIFKPLFENTNVKKVCQNGKYDIAIMGQLGIKVENFYFDTMLASYIIDPDQKHGMDELSKKYLQHTPIPISELIGEKKDPSLMFEADINKLSDYACEDADITLKLYKILSNELKKEMQSTLAHKVEFPLVPVLERMEREGIKINEKFLLKLSDKIQTEIDDLTGKIFKTAGEEFNINSPKQLQTILFEKLGLKPSRKTKTGYSTDARALELMKGESEIIELLLDYRQVTKLKSTYTDALPRLINKKTGRIHSSFNQTVASTGRLSSLDPNLQNIPIRTELGKEIRKAFVPRDKDHVLLSADYSQIELRIMASLSGDKGLINAFSNNEDIHRSTAALVFMVDPEEVDSDMRRKAKEVNFGILYGIGAFGLKNRLGITQSHAKEIIETYFNTFASVKQFMDECIASAKDKGYAETILGRRRYLRNINSKNAVVRQFEERGAINMPIQGTAADMIKIAMINIDAELIKRNTKSKMILQVHDELVFDTHKDEVDELRELIINLMGSALPLNVPVVTDVGVGKNWLEAH
jgi:DNA polymerase-1